MPGTMLARGNIVTSYLMGPTLTPVQVAQTPRRNRASP
jgi:hypothetical protein